MALVKLLISVALVWWCFHAVDVGGLFAALGTIHAGALGACLAFLIAHTLLSAWRWRLVCGALGLSGPQSRDALRWTALSVTLSQVLPSTVGGDAYRISALAAQAGFVAATRSVIQDRLGGVWVLAVLAAAASVITVWIAGWVPGIVAIGAAVLCFIAALPAAAGIGRHPAMQRLPRCRALASEAGRLWLVLRLRTVLLASLGIHFMTIAAVIVLCIGLKPASPLWWQMALLTPAAMLAAAIPISLGGWGVREAALVAGAAAFAIPQGEALAVSVAYGVMLLATGALGAVLWASLPAKLAPS
jgi:uncharacterized membrane protein YbhN (UPF0104 family)